MHTERPHERWIWTELIGFDNRQPDLGVSEYLETTGFTPQAISLLLASPDFILGHESIPDERELPPEFCSRDGHEFNPQRQRQVWTNRQLQRLIANLQERGVQVFLSVFTLLYHNQSHHEWLSDHPETWLVYGDDGPFPAVDAFGRLADGTLLEDYFLPQLVETLEYYGFDGWHAADGWGPLPGYLYNLSFSDGVTAQFAEWLPRELPELVASPCGSDLEGLRARAAWVWRHERLAWIQFNAQRWEQFWRKAMTALHAAGKRALVNAGTRAPLESLYIGGIDYGRLAAAGVDKFLMCTVTAGLAMNSRPGAADPVRHYDFLAGLLLTRGHLPESTIVFLQNTHDVVEEWDAIHHVPSLLEREIYALANLYRLRADGGLQPAADGPLACLGDGLSAQDWAWMRERWRLAFDALPQRALGVTLVWPEKAVEREIEDYLLSGGATTHRLLSGLMARGVPIQALVHPEDTAAARGPLLVLNDQLLTAEERAQVEGYPGGPVVMIGRETEGLREADCRIADVVTKARLTCRVHGASPPAPAVPPAPHLPEPPAERADWPEAPGYWSDLTSWPVSEGFLAACAEALINLAGPPRLLSERENVTLMAVEQEPGRLRVALKNHTPFYRRPEVEAGAPLSAVRILTSFPSVTVRPEGSRFSVLVPGQGVTVVELLLKEPSAE